MRVGLEPRSTRMLCLRQFKEFSSRSRLPAALKLLIATEDDWIGVEDFVLKAGIWLRLLEIEEGGKDGRL